MKELFVKYKSVIKFILTFIVVYISLSICYKFYLDFSKDTYYYPDYITNLVARQSEDILNVIGYKAYVEPHSQEPTMKLIINKKYVVRIIEGCNSISVIILFVSFIMAFSGRLKTTLLYAFVGSVLIYIVNLIRIVIISIGLYHYPWHMDILHKVIFPGIIYGMVFLLWINWVNRFSYMIKKNE